VKVLDRVAERIERSGGLGYAEHGVLESDREKTVRSAVVLANSLPDAKIVIFTRRGTMAAFVAGQRPHYAPILAFAPSWELCRRLSLLRAVDPHYLAFDVSPERTIASAEKYLTENGIVKSGDHLVIVSDIFAGQDRFDSIQLRRLP
jgi:pyruvate kinase